MESAEECVIQFRVEPIDTDEFEDACDLLGDVVPEISRLSKSAFEDNGVIPYYADPDLWYTLDPSEKLQSLLHSTDDRVKPFKPRIETLISKAPQLKSLPLFISHPDLNETNILLYENGQVSGIVDWEGTCKFPFGMGFCRIHVLAGTFIYGKFHMPNTFEAAERGFWEAVFDGVSSPVRETLKDNQEVVQMSVIVGMLLEDLDSEHDFNPVLLEALPMLLNYRIPALRQGGEPPYGKSE